MLARHFVANLLVMLDSICPTVRALPPAVVNHKCFRWRKWKKNPQNTSRQGKIGGRKGEDEKNLKHIVEKLTSELIFVSLEQAETGSGYDLDNQV